MKTLITAFAAVLLLLNGVRPAHGQIVYVDLDPSANWLGFMNVSELPANGGAYVFGNTWGTADLTATFSGSTLTLGPNTIGDPNPFWYVGGGGPGAPGNKNMEAVMYVETTGLFTDQTVTFSANVISNTLISPYTSVAFIKEFTSNYSLVSSVFAPLFEGDFSISLDISSDPTRHVQYGFITTGPNIWITDAPTVGTVQIGPVVPEPTTFGALVGGGLAVLGLRRRRNGKPAE